MMRGLNTLARINYSYLQRSAWSLFSNPLSYSLIKLMLAYVEWCRLIAHPPLIKLIDRLVTRLVTGAVYLVFNILYYRMIITISICKRARKPCVILKNM